MNQFGEFLKKSRINAGLTQEQLAEKMSVSLTSVQKWESGTSQIRNDKLSNLAYLSLNSHSPYIYGNFQIQLVRFFLDDLIFIAVHTDKQLSISLIYIYHPFYAI